MGSVGHVDEYSENIHKLQKGGRHSDKHAVREGVEGTEIPPKHNLIDTQMEEAAGSKSDLQTDTLAEQVRTIGGEVEASEGIDRATGAGASEHTTGGYPKYT